MKVQVLGDSQNNLDGKFVCIFINGDEQHVLKFDLDDWKSASHNGLFLKTHFESNNPKHVFLTFDKEYDLEVDECRELYKSLYANGWR